MAQTLLDDLGCPDSELSILVVDDLQMAELNNAYLGKLGPTNVIAFPMLEGDFPAISPLLMGDVVISMDTAEREANDAGIDTLQRFMELLIHGILHLIGFDHVKSESELAIMNTKSKQLLLLIWDGFS